ncbi:MAG: sensor histidine kinase [Herbinix sp.]|nr:sensor histidine kinase [Herbinix sp.]
MMNLIRKRLNLAFTLVLFVFVVLLASLVFGFIISILLNRVGIISFAEHAVKGRNGVPYFPMLFILFLCVFTGTSLTAFLSKKALNPIRKVIDATRKIGELEELSESFNKMVYELSTIETLRSDFVNNFSHEFKTPIVSVRGFAKLLKEGDLTEEEKQEYLDIIIAESERLADLSTNVLNLSKYESIEIITDKISFRLDEQIRRAVVLMEPKWSVKDIDMTIELEDITFLGNEDLTQQIWINLLDNAIKFTPHGGHIKIHLLRWNQGIRFTIQDNGNGMDEQTKSHIFDKFYQGDNSHKTTGNGLGLALVKRIIKLSGGGITVQSTPGDGSKFTVFLPMD